jgi:hypothetical protein
MRPTEEHPVLLKGLKTMQIIVGAMLAGVVIFSIVLLATQPGQAEREPATADALPLTWLLIGFGAVEVLMVWVFRGVFLGNARRTIAAGTWRPPAGPSTYAAAGDAGRLLQSSFTATIIAAAGMEAGALMSLVAYLLEGRPVALVAAGVFGMLLALQMPTRGRLDQWLESELLKLKGPGEHR